MVLAMAPVYLWGMSTSFKRTITTALLFAVVMCSVQASGPFLSDRGSPVPTGPGAFVPAADSVSDGKENTRAVAGVLAAVLGPFGAHRLYLGTTPKVAIAYGLTFGAFGVLPLIDLGHILFSADTDRFRNNGKILMWSGKAGDTVTPP